MKAIVFQPEPLFLLTFYRTLDGEHRLLGLTFCGGSSALTSPGTTPSHLQVAISGLFSSYQFSVQSAPLLVHVCCVLRSLVDALKPSIVLYPKKAVSPLHMHSCDKIK